MKPRAVAPLAACAAAAALLLGGCPAGPVPVPLVLPSGPRVPGERLPTEGEFVHEGSGLAFPKSAAGFARNTPRRYDDAGDDVGVGYSREKADLTVEATLYVYPALRGPTGAAVPFEKQFDEELAEVRRQHRGAVEVRRAEAPGTLAGRPVTARTVEYELDVPAGIRSHRASSYITLLPFDGWIVKYRVTAMKTQRAAAFAEVDRLLAEIGFPATGLPASDATAEGAPGGR